MGLVETGHAYLHTVYNKVHIYLPQLQRAEWLAVTLRAINNTPVSEKGIQPTTAVYAVYMKNVSSLDKGEILERANIIQDCITLENRI